jgi:hypothetical protein
MPEYRQPGLRAAAAFDKQADESFAEGEDAGTKSDKYIRTTVFLASVLFLVGISTRFPLRGGRYAFEAVMQAAAQTPSGRSVALARRQ